MPLFERILVLSLFMSPCACKILSDDYSNESEEAPLGNVHKLEQDLHPSAKSGCPSLSSIPVSELHPGHPELDFFYAGRRYWLAGHEIPDLACNGDHWDKEDGYAHSAPSYTLFGSLLINPGCKIYLFDEINYEGDYVEYSGGHDGLMISKVPIHRQTCSNDRACFRSFFWSCTQKFPNCVPEDGWTTITSLDNSESNFPTPFTFKQTIGTKWSQEVSESMSVSSRVEASISANFFGVFEASIGVSVETGYNWGSVSGFEKSEVKEYDIGPIEVPAGEKVWIQGAVGTCGDSTVYTQMYKVISTQTETVGDFLATISKNVTKN